MRGYTLIEMTVIIVIIAILALMSFIAVSASIKAGRLSSASDRIVSDLRYAQSQANAYGEWYGVRFDVDPVNTYTIYSTTGTSDSVADNPSKRVTNFIVNVQTDSNLTITSVNIAGGNKVEFSPLGTPYNDKTGSAIASEGQVVISNGSSTRTIRITPNTGRIYVQ
jgi:Tfp pilus assembly protein FimT